MSSVWYVGRADRRTISSASWSDAGVSDAGGTFTWSPGNGYSYPATVFSPQQLAWLDAQNTEFWVGAPDGARTVLIADPVSYVTEARVREILSSSAVTGLTKASVGLPHVDDTSDETKPLSAAARSALLAKVDLPAGGTEGQTLVKAGGTVAWATPSQTGGNSGSLAVQQVTDSDSPSGYAYRVTGSGVAQTSDQDAPSGYAYQIN